MPDPNMKTAYQWAKQLGRVPQWYNSKDFKIHDVAMIVNMLDKPIVRQQNLNELAPFQATIQMRNVLNMILRWWSGCLSMAKTIAFETRDGPVTPKARKRNSLSIRRKALRDRIYADGVKAAPEFRKLRNQGFTFEGIDKKVILDLLGVDGLNDYIDMKLAVNKKKHEERMKDPEWKKLIESAVPSSKGVDSDVKKMMRSLICGTGVGLGAQIATKAMENAKKYPPVKIPKEFTKIPKSKSKSKLKKGAKKK